MGDKILYVSHGLWFAETVMVQGKGNRIYLPKFHGKYCVYYCLETKKFYSVGGDSCNDDESLNFQGFGIEEYKANTWIKPAPGTGVRNSEGPIAEVVPNLWRRSNVDLDISVEELISCVHDLQSCF